MLQGCQNFCFTIYEFIVKRKFLITPFIRQYIYSECNDSSFCNLEKYRALKSVTILFKQTEDVGFK